MVTRLPVDQEDLWESLTRSADRILESGPLEECMRVTAATLLLISGQLTEVLNQLGKRNGEHAEVPVVEVAAPPLPAQNGDGFELVDQIVLDEILSRR